jgi:hypothetical protein
MDPFGAERGGQCLRAGGFSDHAPVCRLGARCWGYQRHLGLEAGTVEVDAGSGGRVTWS